MHMAGKLDLSYLTIADIQKRISARFQVIDSGCFEWLGVPNSDGYGRFEIKGTSIKAHRVMASLVYGAIPAGMVIDHLCRNRICVNPAHLEIVSNKTNLARGNSALSHKGKYKRLCIRGHVLKDNFLMVQNGRGIKTRTCKTCRQESRKRYHLKQKDLT